MNMTLKIRIPKQDYNLDTLIARLKYLETKDCRNKVTETWRVQERSEVTRQFRQALMMVESLNVMTSHVESKMDVDYDLYK